MENSSHSTTNASAVVDRKNVSFKFSKTTSKPLSGNKLDENLTEKKFEKDYVITVGKTGIKSTAPGQKEKDLVIPLIKKNNWRLPDKSNDESSDPESKIKELAIKELLKETSEKNEQWENREFKNYAAAIPLIMQNKIPEGYETDEKMDVSLRPDESKLEDYERVPVEQYGLAILKGMGWKEGDPIGVNSKKSVEPVQVQLRPKGLGLGADTSALKKLQSIKKDDENLSLVKGSYVHVIQGSHKGHYGQVLGLDEENARAIVKLSDSEKIITFPEFSVDVVSKKEYDKESKVINRAAYEKFKTESEHKEKIDHESKERDGRVRKKEHCREEHRSSHEERKRSHGSNSAQEIDSGKTEKKQRHCQDKNAENNASDSTKHRNVRSWVRPQLRVRFIDDKYKKGKYFNQKVVVVDVLSPQCCTCKTDDGRYLEDISPSMLETVIPRTEPGYVMIVQGKYSGELCIVLKRDKSKCAATVQFLSDRSQALKIDYDSICEYVGDITQFD